ncbi:MAG: type II secretion system F family protein [Alphaproteobacteria bacterium]
MARFFVRAVSGDGEPFEGEMEAADRNAVVEQLRRRRQMPLAILPAGEAAAVRGKSGALDWLHQPIFSRSRLKPRDVAIMTRELATLLDAGLTVDQSLQFLVDVAASPSQKKLFSALLARVQGGGTLADALGEQRGSFTSAFVSLVRAGEAGNALPDVLTRLADYLERNEALSQRVRSALVYPLLLLLMAGASIAVLLVVVLPQFTPMFESAGADLPWLTKLVVAVGEAAQAYWWLVLALLALGLLVLNNRLRHPPSRAAIDRWLLTLPLVGELAAKLDTARLARTTGTLLANGVTLPNALAIAKDTLGNAVLRQTIGETLTAVKEGKGLARPIGQSGRFPPLAVHLVAVGERSGHLETMLMKIADIFDQEVAHSIDRMMTLLVPVLTIGVGLVIVTIIGAILSAILAAYQLPI